MSLADPVPWLLVAAAAHLGFQLTVDLVVYPALSEVPPRAWARAHAAHSRRIAPLVGLVYVPLVPLLGWVLVTEPGRLGVWLAVAGGLVSVGTTALVAAPVHGRLAAAGPGARPALLRRIARADRVRTAGAVICAVGALVLVA